MSNKIEFKMLRNISNHKYFKSKGAPLGITASMTLDDFTLATAFFSSGCHNKGPQARCLQNRKLLSCSSGS